MQIPDSNSIIVDTNFLFALTYEGDPNYFLARKLLEEYENYTLITTSFVFAEIYWLLRKRNFHLINSVYGAIEQDIFTVIPFSNSHLSKMQFYTNKYQDRLIDIADASLIVLAEEIGHGNILSKDSDFVIYRWGKNNLFNNLFVDS